MNTPPLVVSVVVTVFNKAPYLKAVLNSFNTQQTECALELIFVDDLSTDNSLDILEAASRQQHNIRIIRNEVNAGPAVRLNQGLAAAQGDYILMVDGDDLISPTTVETMVTLLQANNASMLFGKYGGRQLNTPDAYSVPALAEAPKYSVIENPLTYVIRRRQIGMGVMISRDLLNSFPGCNEEVFVQDISLHLELTKHCDKMIVLNEPFMFGFKDNNTSISTLDTSQGLHDRVLSYYRFFQSNRARLNAELTRTMVNTCISAMWKYHKRRADISTLALLHYGLLYFRNKIAFYQDPDSMMYAALASFDDIPQIRRIKT